MKKYPIILILLIFIFGLTACDLAKEPEEVPPIPEPLPKIIMVTSEGGLDDQSFNEMAHDGLLRADSDFEIDMSVMEPASKDFFIETIEDAAKDGANLVIGVGFMPPEELTRIGELYPDTMFAIVDSEFDELGNVMSLSFREQEGSFLVGVIAALTTETDMVGFIGGEQSSTMEKFEYGFRAGVKVINPEIQMLVDYIGAFDQPEQGKAIAQNQIQEGVDVIFQAAGKSGIGVIEMAQEQEIYAIGVDRDQSALAPNSVLCSMFKRVDHGVYFAIQAFLEGEFEGGIHEFGLDYEAVGYSDDAGNLPEEIVDQVDAYAASILSGDLYVPKNQAEFESFSIPEGGFL